MFDEDFDITRIELNGRDGSDTAPVPVRDTVAIEEPLEIRVRGRAVSVTMRTPGHDAELAIGFLLSEGIVRKASDVNDVQPCGRNEFGNALNVLLAPDVPVDFDHLTRYVFASSSCGLCGKATIESVRERFAPIPTGPGEPSVAPGLFRQMMTRMLAGQATFARTGGVHAAALFDSAGTMLAVREDVGRHNAVDKIIGYALRAGLLPLEKHVLTTSGRASFEILQKALAARIGIVASVSAPTSLAVSFARECGQTLLGFFRDTRMNVYAGGQRVRSG